MYDIPIFTLDVPGTREAEGQTWAGPSDFENDPRTLRSADQES